MSEAQGANSLKAAAPAGAAALAIVAALVGGSILTAEDPRTPRAAAETPATAELSAPDPGPAPGLPGVAFDQTPPAGVVMGMEIVVKFKDDAKVKDIIDAFWKDPASAKAKFEAFKAGRPEFAGVALDRVTYSNELVLVDAGGAPAASRLPAMREIAAKLKSVSDISYAEPNMTAHPGGQ